MLIRRASVADAAAIGSVWLRAALAGYAGIFPPEAPEPTAVELTERCRQSITEGSPGATVLVACRGPGEAVTGTVAAVADPDGAYRGYLRRLYVDPDHWGRGIGRRLHDAIVDHLRAGGSGTAALWVLEENVRARSMYERWGWRATPARRPAYPGVSEVRYVRTL